MGHLINPIAFRLGFSVSWENIFYIKSIYYPEYMHSFFKIRLFLVYILNTKKLIRLGFFYSHFVILKCLKYLFIKIFAYFGLVEDYVADFFYSDRYKKNRYKKHPDSYYNFARLIMVFCLFSFYNENLLSGRLMSFFKTSLLENFFETISSFNFIKIKTLLTRIFYSKFVLFYFIYINLFKLLKKKILNLNINYNYISLQFVYLFFWLNILGRFFKTFSFFLKNLFKSIFPLVNNFVVKFYVIRGDHVTAKFLTRYIAKKLKQNYRLGELIGPIKLELRRISGLINKNKVNNFYKHIMALKNSFILHKSIFHHFIITIKFFVKKFNCNFYYNSFSWFFFNLFETFLILGKKIKSNIFSIDIYLIFTIFNFTRYSQLFLNFFNHLFESNDNILYFKKYDFSFFFFFINNFLFDFLHNSYSFLDSNFKLIKGSLINLNNCISQSFLKINYTWVRNFNKINLMFLRSYNPLKNLNKHIVGYKFHFSGRFRRKQRAASSWFVEGYVPLNTISAKIEYSNYIIPLINSSVNIKLWIYRNSINYSNWYLRI